MVILNWVINSLEALGFSLIVSELTAFRNKKNFIIVSLLWQLFCYVLWDGEGLALSIPITAGMIVLTVFYHGKIDFTALFSALFGESFILIIAYSMSRLLVVLGTLWPAQATLWMVVILVLSKVLLYGVWLLLRLMKGKDIIRYFSNSLVTTMIFEFLLIVATLIVTEPVLLGEEPSHLDLLLFILIVLLVLFNLIIYALKEDFQNRVTLKDLENERFMNDQKLHIIRSLRQDVDNETHRLLYTIISIENMARKGETNKILQATQDFKNSLTKKNIVVDTGNPVFDWVMGMRINDLATTFGVDVKLSIDIPQNTMYDDLYLIHILGDILTHYRTEPQFGLDMKEVNGLTILRFTAREGKIDPDYFCDRVENGYKLTHRINPTKAYVKILIEQVATSRELFEQRYGSGTTDL